MKTTLLLLCILFTGDRLFAQEVLSGRVADSLTRQPLSGISVVLSPGKQSILSNEAGSFYFKKPAAGSAQLIFSGVGYQQKTIPVALLSRHQTVLLSAKQTLLNDVNITAQVTNPYKTIGESDIRMREISNSQEVLRMVPGLFIGQHQGGGKAEQLFLRGFDNDHGTDISLSADGMPINLVSHAHGQGYADSHFIIPETIAGTTYKKGPYDAQKGDLATTGFVDFHTADALEHNTLKLEAGQFATFRALAMLNLLNAQARQQDQSWYAAAEYRYTDSYFDHSQHFNRFNGFTKYHGKLNDRNWLTISVSTLYSKWDASGQIPEAEVDAERLPYYGAIDPFEGGMTSRTNLNARLLTTMDNQDVIKNQLYYSRYKFDLHTNFTFFLTDTVKGDEIRQREARNLYGYNGSYVHEGMAGNTKVTTDFGINARLDATRGSELSHTIDRYTLLDAVKLGDIREFSAGVYLSETFRFSERFSLNAGLRFDQFLFQYNNRLAADSTLSGAGIYKANHNVISPKLNFYYQATARTQFYLMAGKGFHSNDTRVVVAEKGLKTLPAAYSADLGGVFKPADNLLLNAAIWSTYLQKEYVYSGDGGTVDFSGRTRRTGIDFSARYQPSAHLYLDADVNYAHGRAIDEDRGADYIPLAPVWSSTGGLTYQAKSGLNGSLRYRFLGDRPANEDYSLAAKGYFVNDLLLNYTLKQYEIGMTVSNLFNVKWKETQFETLYRLKGQEQVNGMAFTPGTRLAALLHFSYFFK